MDRRSFLQSALAGIGVAATVKPTVAAPVKSVPATIDLPASPDVFTASDLMAKSAALQERMTASLTRLLG
jgi:hypothetical protein